MGAAFWAYGFPAEGAVRNSRNDFMGAVAVVKGTHDREVLLTASGAGGFINDEVAGMALVFPLVPGDIFEPPVFFCQYFLFFSPLHTVK